jgi:hypothetical protein
MDPLPDEALVVRGGRNHPEDIERGTATHPSGITGISVECAAGATVEQLAAAVPHGQVGVTTVGKIRQLGVMWSARRAGARITRPPAA